MKTTLARIVLLALMATGGAPASAGERASTAADQQSINLTVYTDGTALVHDRRRIRLDAGRNDVAWRDVSATMDPSSAILDALDPGAGLSVLEQNFDYDVLDQDSLLRAYVGRDVTIVHPANDAGVHTRRERARILSIDNGIVLQYRDRIETQLDGSIEFPSIPSSLRDRPTLTLDVQSASAGTKDVDLRYLATGLAWHVDYIGTLSADESHMTLVGLVTLSNTSGTSYRNARLQLVAGAIHQAAPPRPMLETIAVAGDTYATNATQESYFEYHLYTIGHATTILNKQTKQIGLLGAHDVLVTKTLELRGSRRYYQSASPDLGARLPIGVYVGFENRGSELGIPLPAGTVRVYENDAHGLAQYVGADAIPHTPRNDSVRLYLGNAFDVVATKKQTDFELTGKCRSRSSYEIAFVNGKDAAQDVTAVEPIPGDWHITGESQPFRKSSSSTATWLVHVPANGRAELTYTADVRWCAD